MKQQCNWKFLLLNLDVVIASIAACALVGLTFAGVIARYVVGSPFTWIEEIQVSNICIPHYKISKENYFSNK